MRIDFDDIVRKIEREEDTICEIRVKMVNEEVGTKTYGSLDQRVIEVIPLSGIREEFSKDAERLKGKYPSRKELKEKIYELHRKGELSNTYHVLDDGVFERTPGLHVGFAEGIGEKIARIKYEKMK